MVSTSTSTNSLIHNALLRAATDYPLITDLKDSDTYFWNGTLSTTYGTTVTNQTDADAFFGGVNDSFGGETSCRLASAVGFDLQNILQGGISLCYMKNMTTVIPDSAVSGSIPKAELFDQATDNKLIEVHVTGEDQQKGGAQDIFITVPGSDSVGSDVYIAHLVFCDPSTKAPNGYQNIEVNKTTGAFTSTDVHDDSNGTGSSELSATLKQDGSSFVFDTNADRTAAVHYSGNFGNYKGQITVSADNTITSKSYNSNTFNNETMTNKNYSYSTFEGTSVSSLKFVHGAVMGSSQDPSGTHSFSGATVFSLTDGYYKAMDTDHDTYGDLATVNNEDFSSDSFFDSLDTPSVDASGYDCTLTPDATVTMDFTNSDIQGVSTECENSDFQDMNFCDGDAVSTARNNVFQYYNSH